MAIRAKFKVDAIERVAQTTYPHSDAQGRVDYTRPQPGELHTVKMSPVYGNGDQNHENTKFWNASPSGSFLLGMVNPEAARQFELGKEYYFDIFTAS